MIAGRGMAVSPQQGLMKKIKHAVACPFPEIIGDHGRRWKGRKARAALPELLTQQAPGPALDQLDQSVNAELRVDIDQ